MHQMKTMRKSVTYLLSLIAVQAASGGENLLRGDLLPDNIGGIVGWRIAIDGDSKVDVSMRHLAAEKPGDPPAVRLLCKPLGVCSSAWSFRSEVVFPLQSGQRYRLSAQMRTHGLLEKDTSVVRMVLADEHWRGGPGIQMIPRDTGGECLYSTSSYAPSARLRTGCSCPDD